MAKDNRRQAVRRSRLRSRELREIREILEALDNGYYISPDGCHISINESLYVGVAETVLFAESPFSSHLTYRTSVEVTGESTVAAVCRMSQVFGSVAALNFASGVNPGGSWHVGAKAQEEDLIRSTTLLAALEESAAAESFYRQHWRIGSPVFSDLCLCSPSILFIREPDGSLSQHPVAATVLSCVAPRADLLEGKAAKRVRAIIRRRLNLVLSVAAGRNLRCLVLGAWGCGQYGNDPLLVADVFRELLTTSQENCFEHVVFATTDPLEKADFSRVFSADL